MKEIDERANCHQRNNIVKPCVSKHEGSRKLNLRVFNWKMAIFEGRLTWFVKVASQILYQIIDTVATDVISTAILKEYGQPFTRFPNELFATDVTVQQANLPCGNMVEVRPYYGFEQILHWPKTESSVLSSNICISLLGRRKGGSWNQYFPLSTDHTKKHKQNILRVN